MEMELENIIAEAVADDFCENIERKAMNRSVIKQMEEKKMRNENVNHDNNAKKKGIVKEYKNNIAKNVALMGVTAVCAYFKLMSPVLYIPIEIACLCAVSYKFGEWKGSVANG